jgi:hypothetical protein
MPDDLPYWQESMPIPYTKSALGEASYRPAPHDLVVDRNVRGQPPHDDFYKTVPLDDDDRRPSGIDRPYA